MAHTRELTTRVRRDLAFQLRRHTGEFARDAEGPALPVKLGESFETWAFKGKPVGEKELSSLSRSIRPTGYWQHLLLVGDEPAAVAYSYVPDRRRGRLHQLHGVFLAELAVRLERAITWLDENVPEAVEARLLVVPAAHVHAFWLTDGQERDEILLVSAPAQLGLARDRLLPPSQFVQALRERAGTALMVKPRPARPKATEA